MSHSFSVIGLNHGHIYGQVQGLLEAGWTLKHVYAAEEDLVGQFTSKFANVDVVESAAHILEDEGKRAKIDVARPPGARVCASRRGHFLSGSRIRRPRRAFHHRRSQALASIAEHSFPWPLIQSYSGM